MKIFFSRDVNVNMFFRLTCTVYDKTICVFVLGSGGRGGELHGALWELHEF